MKRKFKIPNMSNKDVANWYANIKPIVDNEGTPNYLRELKDYELGNAITFLQPTDYADKVDFSKLSVLGDVKMLHRYSYVGFFKPSVKEIISQIPSDMIEKVVAFEMIYTSDSIIDLNDIFNEEIHQGFHVSVVRLYQTKNDTNEKAEPVQEYPVKESTLPIGMSKKQFHQLKKSYGIED